MTITILDSARKITACPAAHQIGTLGRVEAWESSSLEELLERCRYTTVVLTVHTPLRREVLDYLTAIKVIAVVGDDPTVVERDIAEALGIRVLGSPAPSLCERLADLLPPLISSSD